MVGIPLLGILLKKKGITMKHITIDYGIDLGTTNSAISRMEYGVPTIIRSDNGMESMPSCVSFKKEDPYVWGIQPIQILDAQNFGH